MSSSNITINTASARGIANLPIRRETIQSTPGLSA